MIPFIEAKNLKIICIFFTFKIIALIIPIKRIIISWIGIQKVILSVPSILQIIIDSLLFIIHYTLH